MSRPPCRSRGLTLIELLVGVAIAGVLVAVAAPSLYDYIVMQRLKGVSAQLTTDIQYARNEAIVRNALMRMSFRTNAQMTCYTIYTSPANATRCDCRLGVGAACSGGMVELRTVQVPRSQSVTVLPPAGAHTAFAFDHISGGIYTVPTDDASAPMDSFTVNVAIDTSRTLRTVVGKAGRPTVCAPSSPNVGAPAC